MAKLIDKEKFQRHCSCHSHRYDTFMENLPTFSTTVWQMAVTKRVLKGCSSK